MTAFPRLPDLPDSLLGWTQLLLIGAYVLLQAPVLVFAAHRAILLWRWRRSRAARAAPPGASACFRPAVTVQLPIYNERVVVERLIEAAARLRYPGGRLEIQVLDDSNDETSRLARAAVARHRARGVPIRLLHRRRRRGFKAGALAFGLARARGEILVVFDADFVPRPDFLERIVPWFADPEVGMVQARWGHLNRDRSRLTAAQAVLLDAHFRIEHAARAGAGLFFNFNGTAGAWRRTCIEEAGGWQHDTLTEDLDLSYRAQLAGWRFVFDPSLVAHAELPRDLAAFRTQQRRWVRGSVQTLRKLLPRILASPLPWRVRIEAALHLGSNLCYPLAIALAALSPPLLWLTPGTPGTTLLGAAIGFACLAPVVAGLALAQRLEGRSAAAIARDLPAALALAAGSSAHHARAALAGFAPALGAWERTPKTGDGLRRGRARRYEERSRPGLAPEIVLALYFGAGAALAAGRGHFHAVPFLALFAAGCFWVSREAGRGRRDVRENESAAPREREAAPEAACATAARSWASAGP